MGIVGLMNTLKVEGAKYDIRVNTVAPMAASRLTQGVLPENILSRMKPEFVSPLVLYLASDSCDRTGEIFNVGLGVYNRAAVMTGPTTNLAPTGQPPTPEMVLENWDRIDSLEGAQAFDDVNLALGSIMNPPVPGEDEPAPAGDGPGMETIFQGMADSFKPEAAHGVDVVFQFNISGDDGGDWACVIQEQTCKISQGQHEAPGCTLKMESGDFSAMMTGKLPAMQAYTSGKLTIEGDIMKSQLIEKLFNIS